MYKLMRVGGVLRLSDNAHIPELTKNKDWREYQEWLADGNSPDPAETPQEIADREAEESRQSEIRAERDTSGLKQITVAQAHQYIDNAFASATTIAATKTAIKTILKKMVVHILD